MADQVRSSSDGRRRQQEFGRPFQVNCRVVLAPIEIAIFNSQNAFSLRDKQLLGFVRRYKMPLLFVWY